LLPDHPPRMRDGVTETPEFHLPLVLPLFPRAVRFLSRSGWSAVNNLALDSSYL